jgi:penicillin-binding protein 2
VYAQISANNSLSRDIIFADRGVIYDRNGVALATNVQKPDENQFAGRIYAPIDGLSPVLGYIKYPSRDSAGNYYDEDYHGQAGVEKTYDSVLSGQNGSKLTETDARGNVVSESLLNPPVDGKPLTLSIDAALTQKLYDTIASTAQDRGFTGGAGVIMDVHTGEILALTSYPDYDSNVVTAGTDKAEISKLLTDPSEPFLDRAVSGLYTPGSIVKPVVALGALNENVIDPLTKILSTGSISLPNPYDPKHPSVFNDWRPQGWIDMRDALAVSSDVYFYEVGGGFQNQPGLGITKLDNYFSLFGMTEKTGIDLPAENTGYIATPAWKDINFPDDPTWRIGDTYHTAIGQYGTQVTPLEAVRWIASVANGGTLLVPQVVYSGTPKIFRTVAIPAQDFEIVREGMRQGVATGGPAGGLNTPSVEVAGKTGTAELGSQKQYVNSWTSGFFPYQDPHYAFAIIMEKGPETNTIGGTFVMRTVLDWMAQNTPQYLK